MCVLITCEVGGDQVPAELVMSKSNVVPSVWEGAAVSDPFVPGQLPSKLSCDQPALYVAQRMADRLGVMLIANRFSMDLIDVTRSLRHRQLFPATTRSWSTADKQRLIEQIHAPYREQVRQAIGSLFRRYNYVIHLSIRSFALREGDRLRRADVGLLYDPAEEDELDFCLDWIDEMYEEMPMLRVRRNYPRRGTTDSITKAMRTEFSDRGYLGIEVQLNRAWVGRPLVIRDEVIDGMSDCLTAITTADQSDAA